MIALFLFLLAIIVFVSVIAFITGLYKVIFQKEDKQFGVQLLIYSTIAFIIGFGTCSIILNSGSV
jgi:hypothetical protein